MIFLLLFPKYTSEKGVLSINKHHFSKIFLLKKSVLWKGTDCGTEMKKKHFSKCIFQLVPQIEIVLIQRDKK